MFEPKSTFSFNMSMLNKPRLSETQADFEQSIRRTTGLELMLMMIVLTVIVLLIALPVFAQNVGVNNPSPHTKALLDLTASDKGLLTPRLTEAQRIAMFPVADASAKGMIVYQTDNAFGFWYYDGITWRQLLGSDKGWSITGNAGTVDGTNF